MGAFDHWGGEPGGSPRRDDHLAARVLSRVRARRLCVSLAIRLRTNQRTDRERSIRADLRAANHEHARNLTTRRLVLKHADRLVRRVGTQDHRVGRRHFHEHELLRGEIRARLETENERPRCEINTHDYASSRMRALSAGSDFRTSTRAFCALQLVLLLRSSTARLSSSSRTPDCLPGAPRVLNSSLWPHCFATVASIVSSFALSSGLTSRTAGMRSAFSSGGPGPRASSVLLPSSWRAVARRSLASCFSSSTRDASAFSSATRCVSCVLKTASSFARISGSVVFSISAFAISPVGFGASGFAVSIPSAFVTCALISGLSKAERARSATRAASPSGPASLMLSSSLHAVSSALLSVAFFTIRSSDFTSAMRF